MMQFYDAIEGDLDYEINEFIQVGKNHSEGFECDV